MKRSRVSLNIQTPKSNTSVLNKAPGLASKSKVWKESEIKALIAAVEARPELWSRAFRNSEKGLRDKVWKEVYSEFKGINPAEVKRKWGHLRKNFIKSFSPKTASKWAKCLAFLLMEKQNPSKPEKVPDPSNLFPKVKLNSSFMRRATRDLATSIGGSSTSLRDSNLDLSQPKKSPCIQAALTSSRVSSSTPCVPTANTSEAALQTPDPISTFCEYLLAELNMLSNVESRRLRGLLMQVVYNFPIETEPTRLSNYY